MEVGLADSPDWKPYIDKDQTKQTFPNLKEEVTSEAGNEYVYILIMLPRGDTFVWEQLSVASAMPNEASLGVSMTIQF